MAVWIAPREAHRVEKLEVRHNERGAQHAPTTLATAIIAQHLRYDEQPQDNGAKCQRQLRGVADGMELADKKHNPLQLLCPTAAVQATDADATKPGVQHFLHTSISTCTLLRL